MSRTPSALLWRLGEKLSEPSPYPSESAFSENPSTWINDSFESVSDILIDDEVSCSIFSLKQAGHLGLRNSIFPRLVSYVCVRIKSFDDEQTSRLTQFLEIHSEWSKMGDIAQILRHGEILKTLVGYIIDPKLMSWERGLLVNLHRLDLTSFVARLLLICSNVQQMESLAHDAPRNAQCLVDILHALLDYDHLKSVRHTILETLSNLSRNWELNSREANLDTVPATELRTPVSDIADLLPAAQPALTLLNADELLGDPNGEDIVIAVMGPSGTGKSSFINKLLGKDVAQASGGLQSCTEEVRAFGCFHPLRSNQRIIVVDTPGFDDTRTTDFDVLKSIAEWLENTYNKRIKLSGILQFHSIRDSRMRRTPLRNLEMFQRLCGPRALKNVILLTTFWDVESERVGMDRERQLRDIYWEPLIHNGSRIDRYDPPTYERAWEIVDRFPPTPIALAIQVEMVDERKKFWETSVFKFLEDWWHKFTNAMKGPKKHADDMGFDNSFSRNEGLNSASSSPSLDLTPRIHTKLILVAESEGAMKCCGIFQRHNTDFAMATDTKQRFNLPTWHSLRWKGKSSVSDPVFDGHSSDVIIPVMGPTGVGKSTFINNVIGEDKAVVGHGLKSQTAQLQPIVIPFGQQGVFSQPYGEGQEGRLILVDTPGFDDTYVDDAEILERISLWLKKSYMDKVKLGGVLYLHDITQTRMLGTTRRNLDMFRKLVGQSALSSVVLVTTKWSLVDETVGLNRQQQLQEQFWKDMMDAGSVIEKVKSAAESRKLVREILSRLKNAQITSQKNRTLPQKHHPEFLNDHTPFQYEHVPPQNVNIPPQNIPLPNVDTPLPNVDTPLPNVDTPLQNVATPLPNVATPLPNVATPLPNVATPLPNVDTPLQNVDAPPQNDQVPSNQNDLASNFLHIQDELVNMKKFIPQTEAGKTLKYSLEKLIEMQTKRARRMKQQMKGSNHDPALIQEFQKGQEELAILLATADKLKVPLVARLKKFFRAFV
ncbi:hypothetical protein BDN70DRAFT_917762 [Pholiota conissans]|uniref:G domain-containing protein n=1 Tax=Pholiota conissans TaxID=109636 RepID=A0A9P5ZBG6_9AGAR|nr:hypothetical protein BDN70DRAFT_917762 [Pholiota conissans]